MVTMALPVMPVKLPEVLLGQSNGRLPATILFNTPGQAGGPTVRLVEPATRAWRALCAAAAQKGHILKATSSADSYRTYQQQVTTFTTHYQLDPIIGQPTKRWDGHTWWLIPGKSVAAVPGTCIEADAVVLTRRGLVPMKEVQVGDEVWTHRLRWRQVTRVTSFERPVVRVTGSGHPGIDVTREHRWWVFDGWHRAKTVRKGIRYAGTELKVRATPEIMGDLWLSPEYVDGVDVPAYVTPEWVRWAGAWVADGSLHYVKGELTEGLIYPRNMKADRVKGWAATAGVHLTENVDRGDGTLRLRFGRSEARRLQEHFGRLSTARTIPTWLLANAQKLAEPFLEGFLHGDGHRTTVPSKVKHWSFSVSSRRLAIGLRLLGQSIGWHCYLSDRRWAAPSIVKGRLCTPTAETWAVVLYESKPPSGTRLWDHEGYIVGRIRRIVDSDRVSTVYDLTVAEDESFCVDGIYTHNSNHGYGLAIDTGEERDGDTGTESIDAATLAWLVANEHLYGFSHEVQSEPWHIRYCTGDDIPAAVLAFEQEEDVTTLDDLYEASDGTSRTYAKLISDIWEHIFYGLYSDITPVSVQAKLDQIKASGGGGLAPHTHPVSLTGSTGDAEPEDA